MNGISRPAPRRSEAATALRWSPRLFLPLAGCVALLAAAFCLDRALQEFIAQHQIHNVVTFMRYVSRWGDWPTHVVAGIVGATIALARGQRTWLAIFAAMLIACAVAGTLNRIVKVAAGRARPSVHTDSGWNGPRLQSKYHSFPSGHVACSTAFFAVLCFARPKSGIPMLAIPLIIASSRVYLGAHYLSDVCFAAVLGLLCAFVTWRLIVERLQAQAAGVESKSET